VRNGRRQRTNGRGLRTSLVRSSRARTRASRERARPVLSFHLCCGNFAARAAPRSQSLSSTSRVPFPSQGLSTEAANSLNRSDGRRDNTSRLQLPVELRDDSGPDLTTKLIQVEGTATKWRKQRLIPVYSRQTSRTNMLCSPLLTRKEEEIRDQDQADRDAHELGYNPRRLNHCCLTVPFDAEKD